MESSDSVIFIMKNKPVIISGLVVLVILLFISILTVNKPQQAGIKAQTDALLQCQNDGGFVTDQASCSGQGKQIISIIESAGIGGDNTTVKVCCKNTVINTPIPPPNCPVGTIEKPEAECPKDTWVEPSNPTLDGDRKYVKPGVICCPVVTATPTPPDNDCPLPEQPTIKVTNVEIVCPDGC